MVSDDLAQKLFKIFAVLQFLMGSLMALVSLTLVIALIGVSAGESALESVGEEVGTDLSRGLLLAVIMFSIFFAITYISSGYGLWKMKKWQPMLILIIFVMTLIDFIFNLYAGGFKSQTIVGLLVTAMVTALVVSKKKMFMN